MRRSICYSQPTSILAGEVSTWKFIYTTANNLKKGARLKFDLGSKGRDIDWQIPTTNIKKGSNIIYGLLDNGKTVQAQEVEVPDSFNPQYEFILPAELPAGSNFTIVISSLKESKNDGNRAQTVAQRRRPFLLYVDPSGKGKFEDPEVFTMDIKGNVLQSIRLIVPSFVARNKRFDVVIRFEDQYGNLTNNAPDETLIELSHDHLRENLKWKLFVPETGFLTLPNLYFNEAGFYTITLRNLKTKEIFYSAPIICFPENDKSLYWGTVHGESEKIDSTENIENCLRHFRDEKAYNFIAVSPFESAEETSNELWKSLNQSVVDFYEEDRFVTFVGFQWVGVAGEEGVRQIIFAKDNKPILRKKETKTNTLKKIYKSYAPKEIISIPCFTMGKGFHYNFKEFSPEYERVVEIYNAWGSSECTAKEGNMRPISIQGKLGIQETAEGSIQKALQKNYRFGFVAGGLDDRGIYSSFFESDQIQYSPGLTGIVAKGYNRESLFEALYNRSCYATTGERMLLDFQLSGLPMGSETNTTEKPGLRVNRHLSGYVAGTEELKKVEIIRNGTVIKTYNPKANTFEFAYDDLIPLEKAVLKAENKQPPFAYYYVRAIQEDGHIAWGSPVWVDLLPPPPKSEAKKALAKPVVKKAPVIDFSKDDEEDEEDFDEDEE
jgi:hypothetical protein